MTAGHLLNRILLKFKGDPIYQDLSAVLLIDDHLWVASDEATSIERLTRIDSFTFGKHQSFELAELIDGFNDDEGEIDIEGLDYENGYLWVIGSHSTKRKKPKGEDASNLMRVETEKNRYLLARIPLIDGELRQSNKKQTIACLERNDEGNVLITALKQDDYLAPFLSTLLPGKDNGFDIEGFALYGNTMLIGLRGPVLRGMAIILEIEVEESSPGILSLKTLGKTEQLYKKHFVDLNGLGVRDLRRNGKDLLILAGPTMELDGALRVFELADAFDLPDNSLTKLDNGQLQTLFDIPFRPGKDRAEGVALFPGLTRSPVLLVVYDSADDSRKIASNDVLADVFTLK
jgi:hypothetical protein